MTEHRHFIECGINSYVKLGMRTFPFLRGIKEKTRFCLLVWCHIYIMLRYLSFSLQMCARTNAADLFVILCTFQAIYCLSMCITSVLFLALSGSGLNVDVIVRNWSAQTSILVMPLCFVLCMVRLGQVQESGRKPLSDFLRWQQVLM